MTPPGRAHLEAALAASWPAERVQEVGPFRLRLSSGGGGRLTAATATGPADESAIATAAEAMAAAGQRPAFRLSPEEAPLDALLEEAGYRYADPTMWCWARCDVIAAEPIDRLAAFDLWPPLAVQEDLWEAGGVDATRRAAMERAAAPKAALLAREGDRCAGAAFVGAHEGLAMVHALIVATAFRRKGVARNLMRRAARWAVLQGAGRLVLAVSNTNAAARALYVGLGFSETGGYHYRIAPDMAS